MMFHQLTTYLICFSMIGMHVVPHTVYAADNPFVAGLSEAELLEKYPGAKVIHVTPEEYPALEKKLRQRGYSQAEHVSLTVAQKNTEKDKRVPESTSKESSSRDDCAGGGLESAGKESVRVMVDITDDMMKSGNNASGDEAVVLFIIIGTVVLIVWALYVFKYIYDVSLGLNPCGRWNDLTVVGSTTSTSDDQHARFDGLRYATGFRDGMMDVGISIELGRADILLKEVNSLELKGTYWLIGPTLRWRLSQNINQSYFKMNFTAGTTEHSEIGLLAKASLGLLFGVGESMQLGFSWGVLSIDLDEDQGIISDRSQYHYLYGINMGFRF
ncbi:MAG: hypothetical protein GQ553_02775 [Nitrosomonadaceae bacterium]|nr:hypothetical protein [Nitrosomonadaceae bacterium]